MSSVEQILDGSRLVIQLLALPKHIGTWYELAGVLGEIFGELQTVFGMGFP